MLTRSRVVAMTLAMAISGVADAEGLSRFRVRLDSATPDLATAADPLQAQVISRVRVARGMPPQRSQELSEQQIVVVAYGPDGQVLLRTAVLDPRLSRPETADADGHLADGAPRLLPQAMLDLAVPDESTQLALFKPRWNGREYELLPLTRLALDVSP